MLQRRNGKEISKRYGPKFIDSIYDIAERIYVQKHINDTFKDYDYDSSRQNQIKQHMKNFIYPNGFEHKNERSYSYSVVQFYLLKDGSMGEIFIETEFQNKNNNKHKNYIEDKIKEFVITTKWTPAKAKGIKVNSIMDLTFHFR